MRKVSPVLAEIATRLAEAVESESGIDRLMAASAIGRLGWHAAGAVPALIQLMRSEPKARIVAGEAIARIGPPGASIAIPALAEILLAADSANDGSDHYAARALGRTYDIGAVDPLIRAMAEKARDDTLQMIIIDSLSNLGPLASEAVPLLLRHLHAGSEFVSGAVSALGSIGQNALPALPQLHQLLNQESDEHSRIRICEAIRNIGNG